MMLFIIRVAFIDIIFQLYCYINTIEQAFLFKYVSLSSKLVFVNIEIKISVLPIGL